MTERIIRHFGHRLQYSESEMEKFHQGGHRIRHVKRMSEAAPRYSIAAEIVRSRHCNSKHTEGQKIILDVDGNLISKHCPGKMCVYLVSQLTIPVALINERLSEGHNPNDFHFMRYVRCPDAGIDCMGYGEVLLKVQAVPRVK